MDFLNFLQLGQKKEIDGEKWLILTGYGKGFYLAVKEKDTPPCRTYLIFDEEENKKYEAWYSKEF